jgi:hypothetical protein
VFLYLDLRARSETTAMAAVGALDVLGTLNLPSAAIDPDITAFVKEAVRAAMTLRGRDALEVLYLLAERTAGRATDAGNDIRAAVRGLVLNGDELLVWADQLVVQRSGGAPLAFVGGVADAIPSRLEVEAGAAAQVLKLSGFGRLLSLSFPEVLHALLNAARIAHLDDASEVLIEWCAQVYERPARSALRAHLLPFLTSDELRLGRELLRDITAAEAIPLCEAIEGGPSADDVAVARLYAEALCELPAPVIEEWARRTKVTTYFAAYVLALSVPLVEGTVDSLLARKGERKASLTIATFVERAVQKGADWWQQRLGRDEALWSVMLGEALDKDIAAVLEYLLARTARSAIAHVPGARVRLATAPIRIQEHVVKHWAIDWIEDGGEEGEFELWLHERWVRERLQQDPALATQFLAGQTEMLPDPWVRAWRLVGSFPVSDRWCSRAVDAIQQLVRRRPRIWLVRASDEWQHVIEMLGEWPRVHLEACTRALEFCFEHPEAQLGPVVAASFFSVHAAALEVRSASILGIFAFLEWDRGQELRRRLVTAFCQGTWPAEYFILAAREAWLLKKLCRRMRRQWGGTQLLQRAYDTLAGDPEARPELVDTLRRALLSQDSVEDWD